VSEDLPYLV